MATSSGMHRLEQARKAKKQPTKHFQKSRKTKVPKFKEHK